MKRALPASIPIAVACLLATEIARAFLDPFTTLWPRAEGAWWNYDRIGATWDGGTPQFTHSTVRFAMGAPEPQANGDTLHELAVQGATGDLAFWSQLRVARPDVSFPIGSAATSGVTLHDAAHLHIAAGEIAAYDAGGARSWMYLATDTQPGRAFRLQLVPALADSVWLSGTVVGTTGISTPAGSFSDALRVRYVVDFGWGAIPGRPGDAVRAVTRGELFFAPGVGPVLARETFVPAAATRGTPPAAPFDSTFAELQLVAHAITPTPVRDASWSAIKQRFSASRSFAGSGFGGYPSASSLPAEK